MLLLLHKVFFNFVKFSTYDYGVPSGAFDTRAEAGYGSTKNEQTAARGGKLLVWKCANRNIFL